MRQAYVECVVGFFVMIGVLCLIFLAISVSGLTEYSQTHVYQVTANFTDVGGLNVRAPVAIGGVKIGQVTHIDLNPKTFAAVVTLTINKKYNHIPLDSTANIYTAGLLGANYISLTPGYSASNLEAGSVIQHTNPALILQNLIGQLLYSFSSGHNTEAAK